MVRLWLARHAQPLVAPGVCYGALDLPADADATRLAAHALAAELPQCSTLRSSTLQRCEQLTQCLQGLRPDLVPKMDARLTEMDFGAWEGQRWDAIDRAELDAWTRAFPTWPCGGGESVARFMSRVAAAWDDTCKEAGAAVWITHAGVIRAVRLIAEGQREVTRADQWPAAAPAFGGWCVVECAAC